mgnify:CR=1 FL=1
MENKNLISEVISALKDAHNDPQQNQGRNKSTLSFYEHLQLLGKKLALKSYHGKLKGGGEWLWDFVWSDESENDWKDFHELILVCESEWDQYFDALLMDFQKLMVAKANIKLFICQGSNISNNDIFIKLENRIPPKLKSENETWILFISDNKDKPTYWVWNYNKKSKDPNIINEEHV